MTDHLAQRLAAFAEFVSGRIKSHFAGEVAFDERKLDVLCVSEATPSALGRFVRQHGLSYREHALLLLALAPHLQADFYDRILKDAIPEAGEFPQLGFTRGRTFRGLLPTGETALFLFVGEDLERRMEVQQLFGENHLFARRRILWLEEVPDGEPRVSGRIVLSPDYVDLFSTGQIARPRFSMSFPAQLLETDYEWDDLVLHADTLEQIKELEVWIRHGETLLRDWGMRRKLKPGYRALFHGPPGTGKTLTASLLGKYTGKNVYRIDLSMVVSKFIGETEKNLANLFAKAEDKDWILFFDEADALFGKRTSVRDAHDRYANQEVSYLLQRVEDCDGLVILATNVKSNIDDAFSRRFQSIIHFPAPGIEERTRLWQKAFPERVRLADDVNLSALAQRYDLTGAEIVNIVQYACLRAIDGDREEVGHNDIHAGIRKEFLKEGRMLK